MRVTNEQAAAVVDGQLLLAVDDRALAADLLESRAEVERLRERVGMATEYTTPDGVLWMSQSSDREWHVSPARGSACLCGGRGPVGSHGHFPTADLAFSALAKATVSK